MLLFPDAPGLLALEGFEGLDGLEGHKTSE